MIAKIRPSYLRLVRPDPLSLARAEKPVPKPRPVVYAADIIAAVADLLGVEALQMLGKDRNRRVSYARHLSWYLLREVYGALFINELAALFNRDHSTICDGIGRIRQECEMRPETAADVAAVRCALANKRRT